MHPFNKGLIVAGFGGSIIATIALAIIDALVSNTRN